MGEGFFGSTAGVVHEAAHHADLPDLAGADELARLDGVRRRAAVGADLHDASGRARGVEHRATLADRVADRFLDKDVGAGLDRRDHGQRVPMVGRGDDDDLRLLLREQLAVIAMLTGLVGGDLRDAFARGRDLAGIDVAEPDDLAGAAGDGLAEDVASPPAAADERGAEAAAGFLGGGGPD